MPAVMASIALFAAGCGGEASDGAETFGSGEQSTSEETSAPVRGHGDLVVWTDAASYDAIKTVADQVAHRNDISIGVQAVVDTRDAFIAANAAGNGPDVLVGAHDWIGQLVQYGAIEPVELSADQLSGYAANAVKAVTYEGQIFGLPYGLEALALYCNKRYAPDTYPTLDEAIAAGQAALDAGSVDSALNLPVGEQGDPYYMEPLFTSAGGYVFGTNADGSYNPHDLGVGTPGSVTAGERIASLGANGSNVLRTSISTDNSTSLFLDGKAACMVSGPSALDSVRARLGEDGYSVQPIPPFAGEHAAVPFVRAQALYVASNALNRASAQRFVAQGVNNEEAMTLLYEEANIPPAMTAVREAIRAGDRDIETFADAADAGAPTPSIPAMAEVWTPLGVAFAAIVSGRSDAATAMTQAGQTVSAAIAAS